jgi:hypothetical protein
MTNNIFIITEGDHDAAFIYRILRANNIEKYHTIIKDYPKPLNELFKNILAALPIDDLRIDMRRSKFSLNYVLKYNDNTISLNTTIGDSHVDTRKDFVNMIKQFTTTNPDEIEVMENASFAILFFFDADDHDVNKRVSQIKKEISTLLKQDTIEEIENEKVVTIDKIKIGIFVFTKQGEYKGLLEDILLPLMKEGNEELFDKAGEYLKIYEKINIDTGKTKYDDYNYKKALVGTTGQLQKSGTSNTVIIRHTDYLTDEKIKADNTCNKIISFIKKAMV